MPTVNIGQPVVFVDNSIESAALITRVHSKRLVNLVVFYDKTVGKGTIKNFADINLWDQEYQTRQHFRFIGE